MNYSRNLFISLIMTLLVGLPVQGFADDTEIYLRHAESLNQSTRPNVLFILDNSGSMNDPIRTEDGKPTNIRRIDVLKEALLQMLEKVHNVNVGLGRFASLMGKTPTPPVNAPILFPVVYIDERISEIEGETNDSIMDVSVSISHSADDAEENLGTGEMNLADPEFDMTYLASTEGPQGIKKELEIEKSSDDGYEWVETGEVKWGNETNIILGSSPTKGDTLVGLRFVDLGIPKGATIEYAEVQFVSDGTYKDDLEIEIYGAANDGLLGKDPSGLTFGTGFTFGQTSQPTGKYNSYFSGKGYPEDSKNFPKTENSVLWEVDPIGEGDVYKTADIKSIIQELVNRENWLSENSVVLLFQRSASSSRNAKGFYSSSSTQAPPLLRIYWTMDGEISAISGLETKDLVLTDLSGYGFTDTQIRLGKQTNNKDTVVGVRFPTVEVPQGAKIKEARIVFTHQAGTQQDTEGSNPLDLFIQGEGTEDAGAFQKSGDTRFYVRCCKGSPLTSASIEWPDVGKKVVDGQEENIDAAVGENFMTPDITEILQEITDQPEWQIGQGVAFFIKRNGTQTSSNGGFRRVVGPNDEGQDGATVVANEETLPRLVIKFSAGLPETDETSDPNNNKQIVGLRFERVDIPQGAKVKTASIQFTAAADNSSSGTLTIKAEKVDEAQSFSEEDENISSRPTTTASVSWNPETWSTGATYTTPDLSSIVQEIVNRDGWCGGRGGLAFIIESPSEVLRMAKSFDENPGEAPVLNVQFDSENISGTGCVNQNFSGQVSAENDDAEEKTSGAETGKVFLDSDILELASRSGEARLVGFRFKEIPISRGAKILNAHLVLTARNDKEDSTTFKVYGEKSSSSLEFENGDGNLSNRSQTSAKVDWVAEGWKEDNVYQSPDLKTIIQEIVNQNNWETYSDMALFIGGSGQRDAYSFKARPAKAAILRIQVEGYLGEGGEGDFMTVRRRLKKIVQQLQIPSSTTAIVDALYEGALYYRGESVTYGKDRYGEYQYLLSHPATYQGGTAKALEDCDVSLNPYDKDCANEKIEGPAKYKTPIESECQSNHIVLLTDGIATRNTAAELVQDLVGNECYTTYPDREDPDGEKIIRVSNHEMCGIDLAEFLSTTDHISKKEGVINNVMTHTIGFQLGKAWRFSHYETSDGEEVERKNNSFYYKDGGQEVESGVEVKPIYEENPTGTKENQEAVKYLQELSKKGNGKFYSAESSEELLAAFENIIADAMTTSTSFAAPSVSVNRFNNLFNNKEIYYALFQPAPSQRWHGNIKKYVFDVEKGLLDANGNSAVSNNYIKSDSQSYWSSKKDGSNVTQGGAGENVPSAITRKVYSYITSENYQEPAPGRNNKAVLQPFDQSNWREDLNKALLGDDYETYSEEERNQLTDKLIKWIRGEDVNSEGSEGNLVTTDRWKFADPLHSSPVSFTYGLNDDNEQMTKLFVGTNDGTIRMVNAQTGVEDWAFIPQEMLPKQSKLMANLTTTDEHIYGIDGTASLWFYDSDENPATYDPDSGDFVRLFIGMRRGGNNLYALDVTGTKEKPGSKPKLMWVIKGGEGDFQKLGQTWSHPQVTQVDPNYCSTLVDSLGQCTVLLFGGGYHASQDEGFSATDYEMGGGNAIYMVHAETGKVLWWASSKGSGADLQLDYMSYPIPSNLKLVDSDGNGIVEMIYVGDTGGQLWRIDLNSQTGGRLANISNGAKLQDRRRFFYPPETLYHEDVGQIVTISSGTRSNPLDVDVHNQFYAFIETWEQDSNGEWYLRTLSQKDMFDVTEEVEGDEVHLDASDKDKPGGWYLNFQEDPNDQSSQSWIGEKGFAQPIILKDYVFFTTYIPPGESQDACKFFEGKSRLYGLNLFTGGAAYDRRSAEIREGITSDIVVMVDEEGGVRLVTNDPSTVSNNPLKDDDGKTEGQAPCLSPYACKVLKVQFWKQQL